MSISNDKISFTKFDSSAFATFPESILHARKNPLLIENLSDYRSVPMDTRLVKVQEPSCLFKDMVSFFDEDLESIQLPKEEHYRPELTALRLYDSADLWYVLMIVNHIYTVTQYNKATIRYIPSSKLTKIQSFVGKSKKIVRPYEEREEIINTIL